MINAGAYVFNADTITVIPEGRPVSVERETFPSLLSDEKPLYGFAMHGYWNDIGTHASYLQAHKDLLFTNNRWTQPRFLRKRGRLHLGSTVRGQACFGQRLSIGKNVLFEGFVSCGDRVVIEEGGRLKDSVILDGCRIGAGVQISGAVIGAGCSIGANSIVGEGTVLADKTVLPEYTRC
jgi:mannose-1-phosphate guanylyltransferase